MTNSEPLSDHSQTFYPTPVIEATLSTEGGEKRVKPISCLSKCFLVAFSVGDVVGMALIGLSTAGIFGVIGSISSSATIAMGAGGFLFIFSTSGILYLAIKNCKGQSSEIEHTSETEKNVEVDEEEGEEENAPPEPEMLTKEFISTPLHFGNRYIMTYTNDQKIRLWDPITQKRALTLDTSRLKKDGQLECIALAGEHLVASIGHEVYVCKIENEKVTVLFKFDAQFKDVNPTHISIQGDRVLVGIGQSRTRKEFTKSEDLVFSSVQGWSISQKKFLFETQNLTCDITQMALHKDQAICVFDLPSGQGQILRIFPWEEKDKSGKDIRCTCAKIFEDVVVCKKEGALCVISLDDPSNTLQLPQKEDFKALVYDKDAQWLAIYAGMSSQIHVWSLKDQKLTQVFELDDFIVQDAQFVNQHLIVCGHQITGDKVVEKFELKL